MPEERDVIAYDAPAGVLTAPTTSAQPSRFGILGTSTLLRHLLLAVLGVIVLFIFIKSVSDVTSNEVTPIPYYVCAAAGLTLLVGLSGQISLGHGAFMMVGAYTFALIWPKWNTSHPNLAAIGTFAAAVVVSALFGAVVGVAAARLRGPYLAGATLALAVGLPSLTTYDKLSSHLKGNQGLSVAQLPPPSGLPKALTLDLFQWPLFVGGVCAIIVLWLTANLIRSRVGRSMRAVRDDEIAASLAGLSVARVQVLAFIVSAGWAGLGGALLALVNSNASPNEFQLQLSLALLAAVVIGGLGSLTGAVIGSIFVAMLNNYWARDLANALSISSGKVANNLPLLIYGVLLAVSMLIAPGGVAGILRRLFAIVGGGRRK